MLEHIYEEYKDKKIVIDQKNNSNCVIDKSGYYEIINYQSKNIITINEGIEVIVDEKIDSNNDIKTTIIIGKGTTIDYYSFNTKDIKIDTKIINNGGIINDYVIDTSKNSNTDTVISLREYEANLFYNLVLYANENNKQNHIMRVNHEAPKTKSDFFNYGVIDDEAFVNISVTSYIEKSMCKSSAHQSSRVISLGTKAKANLDPILLIDEFDVLGGHGATFGVVNPNDIYYMKTRGISEVQAKKILAVGNLLSKIPMYRQSDISDIIERRIES